MRKILALILCLSFIFNQVGFAQAAAELNLAGYLGQLHSNIFPEKFRPLHLRYFSYDNLSDSFRISLDKGNLKDLKGKALEDSSKTLLNYFLIGVTLPDEYFWVNLRPDSELEIINETLAKTDIGKILLEADLQLKKDTAKFTSPENPTGKAYWDKLYKKAGELFGTENVTIPTLTRPWIVPDEIIIRETNSSAYIYKATLKVMLEQDHLKNSSVYNFTDERLKKLNEYSSELIRKTIIPQLTKEVNNSKRYAELRQVYYSLILARWFKARFNGKTGQYASLINKKNLSGLTSTNQWSKSTYFNEYQRSFKEGEYNIKTSVYGAFGQAIRTYFSGGIGFQGGANGLQMPHAEQAGSPIGVFRSRNDIIPDKGLVTLAGTDGILKQTAAASPVKTIKPSNIFKYKGNSVTLVLTNMRERIIWGTVGDNSDSNIIQIGNDKHAATAIKTADVEKAFLGTISNKDLIDSGIITNSSLYAGSPVSNLTAQELTTEVDYIMQMLGIKDHARIVQIFKNSIDPVALVDALVKISGRSKDTVLSILDLNEFFKTTAANYRLRTNPGDRKECQNQEISVEIGSSSYAMRTKAQKDIRGGYVSQYLNLMRQQAAHVPFVFRDGMENFVGKFLDFVRGTRDFASIEEAKPGLLRIIKDSSEFLKTADLTKINYVLTSGIGANEMYSHQLARILNAYFKVMGIQVRWIVVNNPAHLKEIPQDANNENTLVFEMSRSGGTKETVDFFNSTKNRFKQRIVAANSGKLKEAATLLSQEQDARVLIIDDTPGDIGGRQMNRKTLMVFTPLFIALAAGLKDTTKAEAYLADYAQALLDSNKELGYNNGLGSAAISFAEFLFRHRAGGRNKFSVIFDSTLDASAKELFQLNNEGANKNIAGGSNNNILLSYSLENDRKIYETIFQKSPNTQLPIFILDSSNPNYVKNLEYIEYLKTSLGIPCLVITVKLGPAENVEENLKTLAKTSALLQDMIVYFTYITNQDANSNPAVKFVREITAAMFEILKAKKASGSNDIRISFADVATKMAESAQASIASAKTTVDNRNAAKDETNQENLAAFKDSLDDLAYTLGISQNSLTAALLQATSKSVLQTDVGEAGGSKIAEIGEAFSRSEIIGDLGQATQTPTILSLDQQTVIQDNRGIRISVATATGETVTGANTAEKIANYLLAQYQLKKNTWEQLALSCMESDAANPQIREINEMIAGKFAGMNITTPVLPLPGVAHTGIEAVMSHPESVFNIAIMYTSAYGQGLGTTLVEQDVTIDDATYVYGIANVIRMALGGTPSIIFEVRNSESLETIQNVLEKALSLFREKIDSNDATFTKTPVISKEQAKEIEGDSSGSAASPATFQEIWEIYSKAHDFKRIQPGDQRYRQWIHNNPDKEGTMAEADKWLDQAVANIKKGVIDGKSDEEIILEVRRELDLAAMTYNTPFNGVPLEIKKQLRVLIGEENEMLFIAAVRKMVESKTQRDKTAAASPTAKLVEGAEIIPINNQNIQPATWGTAGYRAAKDSDNFNNDNVGRQAAGFAEELSERIATGRYRPIKGKKVKIAVAFDARTDSDEYAYHMAKVLSAYDGFEIEVIDEPLPTPVVCRLTQTTRKDAYDFAFHLTPSHNQLQYGGIKFFTQGMVNEDSWTQLFNKKANVKMEYPVNSNAQINKVRVTNQQIEEYLNEVFPGLPEKFAAYRKTTPKAQFYIDLMDGAMASFAPLFERIGGIKIVRRDFMKNKDYTGQIFTIGGGKKAGFMPDATQSAFYENQPEYQDFLANAPDGSIYFVIDGDGDRLNTLVKKNGKVVSMTPNQFGPLATDYVLTNKLFPIKRIIRTFVTTAGMDAVARYHKLDAPVIEPVGSKYFNPYEDASALEESGHFRMLGFFDDTIFQMGLILTMISQTNKDVFTLLDETQKKIGYKGVDKRDDFENLTPEDRAKFTTPLEGTPEQIRVNSQKAVQAIVAASGKELLEALVVVEREDKLGGKVVKLEDYVSSLFTDKPLVLEGSNKGLVVRFTDLSWGGARLSGTGNTGRLYTEGRASHEERQKIADAFVNVLGLPRASSSLNNNQGSDEEYRETNSLPTRKTFAASPATSIESRATVTNRYGNIINNINDRRNAFLAALKEAGISELISTIDFTTNLDSLVEKTKRSAPSTSASSKSESTTVTERGWIMEPLGFEIKGGPKATREFLNKTAVAFNIAMSAKPVEQTDLDIKSLTVFQDLVETAKKTLASSPGQNDNKELRLTKREVEVLSLIAEGKSSKEAANTLVCSKRTIDFHLARIYDKLQVSNRSQAIRRATELGLILPIKTLEQKNDGSAASPAKHQVTIKETRWSNKELGSRLLSDSDEIAQFIIDKLNGVVKSGGSYTSFSLPEEFMTANRERLAFSAKYDSSNEAFSEAHIKIEKVGTAVATLKISVISSGKAKAATNSQSAPSEGSSPSTPNELGGIDFRTMHIVAQPLGNLYGLSFNMPKLANLETINLDESFAQIKNLVDRGIIPSDERVKEFVAACFHKKQLVQRKEDILTCIAQICKLQEESASQTSKELKEALMIVDNS